MADIAANDWIVIEALAVDAVIGVYDWERDILQRLVLDLSMRCDISAAAAAADVERTLDYAAIAERVCDFVAGSRFKLVETLAERVAALVLEEFDVDCLRLKVSKPGAVANAANVGVRIERRRP